MPKPPVPESFHDLLESTALAHLATIGPDGRPQVNPVWFIWEAPHILIGVREDTVKYRNLRANPHVALSILDPGNPYRYLELRGTAVDFTLYTTLEFVNRLSQKYEGKNYPADTEGDRRYRITIAIDRWTAH